MVLRASEFEAGGFEFRLCFGRYRRLVCRPPRTTPFAFARRSSHLIHDFLPALARCIKTCNRSPMLGRTQTPRACTEGRGNENAICERDHCWGRGAGRERANHRIAIVANQQPLANLGNPGPSQTQALINGAEGPRLTALKN